MLFRSESVYDIQWNQKVNYGEIFHEAERQFSAFNFEQANVAELRRSFDFFESEVLRLAVIGLTLPAYDYCLKCSHTFNLLDARKAVNITERTRCIGRIRAIARQALCEVHHPRWGWGHRQGPSGAEGTVDPRRGSSAPS